MGEPTAQEELERILSKYWQIGMKQSDAEAILMTWHQRHQPPRLTREQVEGLFDKHHQVYSAGKTWRKVLIDELCALALPPRPTVTKAQIEFIVRKRHTHDIHPSVTATGCLCNLSPLVDEVYALCTDAGEEPRWCEHWRPEIWCGRPAFARRTGTETDVLYRESPVRFCDRCGTPRPEGR